MIILKELLVILRTDRNYINTLALIHVVTRTLSSFKQPL